MLKPNLKYLEKLKHGATKPTNAHTLIEASGLKLGEVHASRMDYLTYGLVIDGVWYGLLAASEPGGDEFDFTTVHLFRETIQELENGNYRFELVGVALSQALAYMNRLPK